MVLDSLSGEDRAQLIELYARSVMLLHLRRYAEWADLFEPQAVVQCAAAGASVRTFTGRDELLRLGQRMGGGEFDVALGDLAPPLLIRHALCNVTLFNERHRRASGYAFVTMTTVGGSKPPRWLASGLYTDRFFRGPAGFWRFSSRLFRSDAESYSLESVAHVPDRRASVAAPVRQ
jgi:hypothetical protein